MRRFAFPAAVLAVALVATIGITRFSTGATTGTTTADGHLLLTDDNQTAILGYDVVSYFADGKPTPGNDQFTTQYQGATWKFATAEHLRTFRQSPERYLPQYGGYCAWGVGDQNDLFPSDPTAWRIVDGKLYLNYNAEVQSNWLKDIPGFIKSANQNWPGLQAKHAKTTK